VDGPGAARADGSYPDGVARLLRLIAAQMPRAEVDQVWAFPGVRRDAREYGVAVISRREPGADERRRLYRARYMVELKGEKRGTATLELEEAAEAPEALLARVIDGVARRADDAGEAELVDLTTWKADDAGDGDE